jgi:hypothetical protein
MAITVTFSDQLVSASLPETESYGAPSDDGATARIDLEQDQDTAAIEERSVAVSIDRPQVTIRNAVEQRLDANQTPGKSGHADTALDAVLEEPLEDRNVRYMPSVHYGFTRLKVSDKTPAPNGQLTLLAFPNEEVRLGRCYRGMRVFLVNRSSDSTGVMHISGYLLGLTQEALDEDGKWKPIEGEGLSCGVGLGVCRLGPDEYLSMEAFRYTGSFKTRIRFRLALISMPGVIYSNEFEGNINKEQFTPPKAK